MLHVSAIRQHSLLRRTSLISWRHCPRAGMWRKRNAWRKSENFSSTSLPLLMLFMRCSARWMLILTIQCDSPQVAWQSPVWGSWLRIIKHLCSFNYLSAATFLKFTNVQMFKHFICSQIEEPLNFLDQNYFLIFMTFMMIFTNKWRLQKSWSFTFFIKHEVLSKDWMLI